MTYIVHSYLLFQELENYIHHPSEKGHLLIAKEITKIHEEFIRADVDKIRLFKNSLKGELTIVISENNIKTKNFDKKKIVNKIKKYLKKYSLKDTVNIIFETEKINKKKIYDLCLKIKNEKNY